MRTFSRTAFPLRASLLVVLALSFGSVQVRSQVRGTPRRGQVSQEEIAKRARRTKALTLLVESANHARLFDDLFYRARIQALAADALWPHDMKQARAIFRRAWEAATAADKAEQEEDAREAGALPGATPKVTEARDEILRMAAKRDAGLAEAFLQALAGEKDERNASGNEALPRTAWRELSPSGARRLALADELLEAGAPRRASELAAPLANEGATADLIAFILRLGMRNSIEADALYLRLLNHATANPRTDANAVLLLSTPIVSPGLMAVVDEFGSLQFRALPRPASHMGILREAVTSRTWPAFYNLAASVLARPLPPRDALTLQELMARFYATGRLLPHLENPSSPAAASASAIRARHSELFNEIESSRREQLSAQFGVNSLTPAGYVDPLRLETEQLSRAADAAERRKLALSIIKTAVRHRFWDRAKRAMTDLEDTEERRKVLAFIQTRQIKDISTTYADEKEDDFEGVAKFVRNAEVPPAAKAWGLAQAAIIANRKRDAQKSQKVAELITEAEGHAARVPQGSYARVAAYGVLTNAAVKVAPARAWELLGEFVKSANALEDFIGDGFEFDMATDEDLTLEPDASYLGEPEVFRSDAVFATMVDLDFEKALEAARTLDGDVPQAFAVIAIARHVLDKQSSGVNTPKARQ